MPPSAPAITADDIPQMIESPQFAALPHEQRTSLTEDALADASRGFAGKWDQPTFQKWGQFADTVRGQVAGMESAGEKAKHYGGVIADAARGMGRMAIAGAADLSVTNPDGSLRMPGGNMAEQAGYWLRKADDFGGRVIEADQTPLNNELGRLKSEIDQGKMPLNDQTALNDWLDQQHEQVKQAQVKWYADAQNGDPWPADYADTNGLLNPNHAALLSRYMQTRNPALWDALSKSLSRTPRRAQIDQEQQQSLTDSPIVGLLNDTLGDGYGEHMAAAGDPLQLAMTFIPAARGASALAGAGERSLAAIGKEVAKTAALNAGIGAAEAGIQEPGSTFEDYKTAAKDMMAVGLGFHGAGAAAGKLADVIRARRTGSATPRQPAQVTTEPNPFEGPIEAPPQPTETGGVGAEPPPEPKPFPVNPADLTSGITDLGDARGDVRKDFGPLPFTPEAQARIDAERADYETRTAQTRAAARAAEPKQPVIPDAPYGGRDILDFVNENVINVPRRDAAKTTAGEHDWMETAEMPRYYRQFLMHTERGSPIDQVAQRAFDAGLIPDPTPDALMKSVQDTIAARTTYKMEVRKREKQMGDEERRMVRFDKAQTSSQKEGGKTIAFHEMFPGDELTIDGEAVKVKNVETDQDGYPQTVTLEDGKRFGVLKFDANTRGGIIADEWKPKNASVTPRPASSVTTPMAEPEAKAPVVPTTDAGSTPAAGGNRIRDDLPEAQPIRQEIDRLEQKARELHGRMAEGQTKYLTNPIELLSGEERQRLHDLQLSIRPKTAAEAKADVMAKRAAKKQAAQDTAPEQDPFMAARTAAVNGPLPSLAGHAAVLPVPGVQRTWSGEVQTLHGIRQHLLESVGLPAVGVGRIPAALGIYRVKPETIRLKAINDLPVLAHEVGHAVHYRVLSDNPAGPAADWGGRYDGEMNRLGAPTSKPNYTPDMIRKEGVAEFTRLWLTDPVKARAEAPLFSAFWESQMEAKNPKMAAALRESQRRIQDYIAMPAVEKAKAQIVFDPASEKPAVTIKDTLKGAYAKWVDTLAPAIKVVRKAAEIDPTLAAEAARVETWMENHRGGWSSKAHSDVFGTQTDLNGNRLGPGMAEILKDIQPGDSPTFSTYLALKRAAEIEARGQRSGFEQGKLPPAEMQAMEQRFEATRQKLLKWSENNMKLLVDAGLLDAKSEAAIRAANQDYVPFYRLYEKMNGVSFGPENSKNAGGYVDLNSGIRRLKGSDLAIIDPLQSLMKNAFMFRKLAEQNHIGVQFFDLMRQVQGHGQWGEGISPKMKPTTISHDAIVKKLIDEGVIKDASQLPASADLTMRLWEAIKRPDTSTGEVVVFKNGQRQHWEIKDPHLMEALKTADADAVKLAKFIGPTLTKVLTFPTRVLRFGATGGPWFALPNFIRDQMSAGVQSRSGYVPFWDGFKGALETMKKGDMYNRWVEAGGKFHGITTGTEAFTSLLEDALPKDRLSREQMQALGHPRNVAKALGYAGQLLEEATRVGEFMRAVGRGADDRTAANASKYVSLNFARAGERSRAINMVSAFFNAKIQDLDMVTRNHLDPARRANTMMKGLMYITVPSVLTWALGKDDPDIQNLPEWRKNMFWNINMGPVAQALGRDKFILSLPKPFLMGAIYGTSVERALDQATGRDPNGAKKAVMNLLAGFAINPADIAMDLSGIRPISEVRNNFDRFRDRPIVPEQMQHLPKEQQYDTFTSETAKQIGRFTGQSPMMIDHLIRGYFATAGKYGTDAIDWGMAKLGISDVAPKPAKDAAEMPVLSRFAGSPYEASAFVTRFYNAAADMEGKMSVFNKQTDQMTSSEQQRWWQKNGSEIEYYNRTIDYSTGRTGAGDVRKAQQALSEINGAMKSIQAAHQIDPAEKRQRLMQLARQRDVIAENAFKNLFPQSVVQKHY